MKLSVVGPTAPYRGGISHYNTLLCQALEDGGHDVRAFNFTRMYPELLFPGKTQLDASRAAIGFPSERTIDSVFPPSWRSTGKRIGKLAPDRIVFQWWHPFFAPSYAAVSFWARRYAPGARQVFVCHNVRPHEASPIDQGLLRLAYSRADAFVVHAAQERDVLAELAPRKPAVVHPHPTYDVFRSGQLSRGEARQRLELDGDVLLFFGYVREYKGLRFAIEAMPHILKRRPVTLVVAGEFYEERAPYEARIKELGLESRVRLVDRYIANEDVAAFFTASDLVVQPYVHATQSGISQIAFGFDKPVVATNVGGLPEVIRHGETGFLVPPGDANAIAEAVLTFFEDGHQERMARAIRSDQERFSWTSLASAVLSV